MNEQLTSTTPPQQSHFKYSKCARTTTHSPLQHSPRQLMIPAADNKKIVGFANTTEQVAVRKGRRRDRFFFLHQDSCANCIVVSSPTAQACISNRRPAGKHDHIMMNAFPARVTAYGDFTVELFDEQDKAWTKVVFRNAAVVPSSKYDLLGFSAYQKQLPRGAQLIFVDGQVKLPLPDGRVVTGSKRGGLFSLRGRNPNPGAIPRARPVVAAAPNDDQDHRPHRCEVLGPLLQSSLETRQQDHRRFCTDVDRGKCRSCQSRGGPARR